MSCDKTNSLTSLKNSCVRNISCLTKDECIELLKIIHSNDITTSENNNGTFVNLTKLTTSQFKIINEYVESCHEKYKLEKANRGPGLTGLEYYFNNDTKTNNDFYNKFNEIKNSKKLNSLEKSVIRDNITKVIVDTQEDEKKEQDRIFKMKESNSGRNFFIKKKSRESNKRGSSPP
jgi:hypothetical protein